jgi:FkbM family methyltransferase
MKFLRKLIKNILPDQYYNDLFYFFIRIFKNSRFSLNKIDLKLEKYINYNSGFYVELGANNGFKQSNTLFFEIKKKWQGVLVEAEPKNFLKCQRYRGKRNKIYNNACVSFDYKQKFVEMHYADLMTTSTKLDSDIKNIRNHLKSATDHLHKSNKTYIFRAKAKTLNEILLESKAPNLIDLMSLDVEGSEFEVLKGINFKKFQFKFILIESRKIERIQKFLRQYKYNLIDKFSHHDYLFALKSQRNAHPKK